jgi:hypothetical protein
MYMRFLGGGVGHAEASLPQPTSSDNADMDCADDRDVEDIGGADVEIEDEGADDVEEPVSAGEQSDDDEDSSDTASNREDDGTDTEDENDSEDEGFAMY